MNENDIREEINSLKHEVSMINKRIDILESNLNRSTISENVEQKELKLVRKENTNNKNNNYSNVAINLNKVKSKPNTLVRENIENNLGKYIMAILASLLIFVGLSSFIVLIFHSIPEFVKLSLAYLVSISVFLISFHRLQKNKNTFFLSLNSCAIGGLYISILLTHFYFKYINEIVLFICLIVCSLFVFVISRNLESTIHTIISYLGICFSLTLAINSNLINVWSFAFLSIFLYFINKLYCEKIIINNRLKTLLYFIFYIELYLFSGSVMSLYYNHKFIPVLGLTVLFLIFQSITSLGKIVRLVRKESNFILFTLLSMIISGCFFSSFERIFDIDNLYFILYFIYFEYLSRIEMDNFKEKYKYGLLSFIYLLCSFSCACINFKYFYLSVIVILLLSIYIYSKGLRDDNKYYLHTGIISSILCLIPYCFSYKSEVVYILLFGIILLYLYYIYATQKQNNWNININLYYILTLIILCSSSYKFFYSLYEIAEIDILVDFNLWIIIGSLFVLFFDKLVYDSKNVKILSSIFNYIFMFIGIIMLGEYKSVFIISLTYLVLTAIQCCVYLKPYLDSYEKSAGYYIGTKLTSYINLVLKLFFMEYKIGYLYSLICIVLAILFILYGFTHIYKSFRIYGLVLSIIGVLKLLLIDISYENSIMRIVSFMGAGILCFGIVYIYNIMDKREKG